MLDPYLRIIASSYEGIALIAQERTRPTHLQVVVLDPETLAQLHRDEVLEGYHWTATTCTPNQQEATT